MTETEKLFEKINEVVRNYYEDNEGHIPQFWNDDDVSRVNSFLLEVGQVFIDGDYRFLIEILKTEEEVRKENFKHNQRIIELNKKIKELKEKGKQINFAEKAIGKKIDLK